MKLNCLRNKYRITPYLYGQSVFAVLLNRYTGQNKFGVSYLVAIKEGADFIYGANINTNIIPYDFNKVNNIIDLINQSKEFIKSLRYNGVIHSYLPISDIISVSNKDILNFAFIQTNLKEVAFEFKNIKSTINNTNIELSNVFEQEIRNEEINYRVRYKLDHINTMLLSEFIDCYKRLFIQILEELESLKDISKLHNFRNYDLLSYEQYSKIINIWNNTDIDYSSNKLIYELFEELS